MKYYQHKHNGSFARVSIEWEYGVFYDYLTSEGHWRSMNVGVEKDEFVELYTELSKEDSIKLHLKNL
jgi:hypothetical protein